MFGSMSHEHKPFYGHDVLRDREQAYIRQLLEKYRQEPVTDELKKKVYEELAAEKFHGRITIPFRVVVRRDAYRRYPPVIDVILDTKV